MALLLATPFASVTRTCGLPQSPTRPSPETRSLSEEEK